jgi:hypothetical protein
MSQPSIVNVKLRGKVVPVLNYTEEVEKFLKAGTGCQVSDELNAEADLSRYSLDQGWPTCPNKAVIP